MARFLQLFMILTLLPAGAAAQEPIRVEPDADPAIEVDRLKAEILELLEEHNVPGASIALVERDRTLWAGGVGKADVAAGVDVTADHLFRVGSIAKSFTALAVMTAVEDGLVDLESPVRELAPEVEFTNPWAETHPVTVAMVMEHTSGFDDIHVREYAKVDDPEMSLEAGLAYNPASRRSRWRPGTHMSYCNSGPPIAAFILQKVTGIEFEDYARQRVFDPIGMTQATYRLPEDPGLMAKGYEGDGETEAHYDHIIVRPSGALNASARDMARYLRLMINRGTLDGVEVVGPQTVARMETPTTTLAARAGYDFGYGLGNYASVVGGHRFQGHNGGITGFASTSAYSADLGVGFFVSVNRSSGAALRGIAELLGERLTASAEIPVAEVAALDESALSEIAGFYQNVTPRQQLGYALERFFGSIQRVNLEGGELYIKAPLDDEARQLIPVGSASFRFEDQPEATVFRVAGDGGDFFLQQGLGTNSRQVSGAWVLFQYATAAAVVLVMLSALLFALIWVPLKAFGRLQRVPLATVLTPLLTVLCPLAAFCLPFMLSSNQVQDLGTLSWASLTLFVGSWVFVVLTLLSLYTAYRAFSMEMSRLLRAHTMLVSVACAVLLLYFWTHGLIGLKAWAV